MKIEIKIHTSIEELKRYYLVNNSDFKEFKELTIEDIIIDEEPRM